MLFPSYVFLFAFLPISLGGFYLVGRALGDRAALVWLLAASFVFYGWWNPPYVLLLAAMIALNYFLAMTILSTPGYQRAGLWFAVIANLIVLGYFKYAGFLVTNWNHFTGSSVTIGAIILPLAISFFTFQQIGYLSDTARGVNRDRDLLRYALFSSFFPVLIAGPIVHAREVIPQLEKKNLWRLDTANLSVGLTIFGFGLAKKVLIADPLAIHVDALFGASATGLRLTPIEAWLAALGITVQLYFDFSGYSDMAIGLARMLGILLPENFFSPYKALSIADFWNRWHITLSRFLRDRMYFPMTLRKGRPRPGPAKRWAALFTTMVLAGLWHGAGWTYVAWGAIHGAMLVVHDGWRLTRRALGRLPLEGSVAGRTVARAITFVAIVLSMIVFRADSFRSARAMMGSCFGLNATALALPYQIGARGLLENMSAMVRASVLVDWSSALMLVAGGLLICFFAPTTQEILLGYSPTFYRVRPPGPNTPRPALQWHPNYSWGLALAATLAVCILRLNRVATFIYFKF
jgi:alginate O-acetyltransferase complex protein AlgI